MEPILESVQPVLMSRDVITSIGFYERLGFTLAGQDAPREPKYARIQRDGIELHRNGTMQRNGIIPTIDPHIVSLSRMWMVYGNNSTKTARCPMLQLWLTNRGVLASSTFETPT
jgi:hypothetical protein